MKRLFGAVAGLFFLFVVTVPFASALSITDGNAVKLLGSGGEFYGELFAAADSARVSIYAEYYSVGRDSVSTVFLELLAKKASEGLDVRLMVDGYGSWFRENPVDEALLESCRARGVLITVFHPYTVLDPLPRNHRKLTVIDGRTAFVGGMNLDDAQMRGRKDLGTVYDLSARIDGPAAASMQGIYLESWDGEWPSELPVAPKAGDIRVDLIPTMGNASTFTLSQIYVLLIDSARSSIRLVNAYFMPTAPVKDALVRASARGVHIDILIGDHTDLTLLKDRPLQIVKELSKKPNIDFHLCPDSFFHEKVMSIDGRMLLVGSGNLDFLSRKVNFELSVLIHDPEITAGYDARFDSF